MIGDLCVAIRLLQFENCVLFLQLERYTLSSIWSAGRLAQGYSKQNLIFESLFDSFLARARCSRYPLDVLFFIHDLVSACSLKILSNITIRGDTPIGRALLDSARTQTQMSPARPSYPKTPANNLTESCVLGTIPGPAVVKDECFDRVEDLQANKLSLPT